MCPKKHLAIYLILSIIAFLSANCLYASERPDEDYYTRAWRSYRIGTRNDKDQVIRALRRVVREFPDEYLGHYYLGIILNEDGSDRAGLNHLKAAMEGFPESADIKVRIGQILETRATRVNDALDYYRQALKLEPHNATALSKLGIYKYQQQNYSQAYEYLSLARRYEPDNVDTLRALGGTIAETGIPSQAIEILEQVLLFNDNDAEAHWLLARAYEKNNQSSKASKHFERARGLGRRAPQVRDKIGYDHARSLHRSGQMEEAISEYRREIRRNDDKAKGWSELALVYEDIGAYEDAIKAHERAYAEDRSYAAGILRAGDIYRRRDDYENAREMYEILRRNRTYGEEARRKIAELDDLIENMQRAELRRSVHITGNTDADIIAIYEEMLELDRNDVNALQGLMDFYKQRGYYNDAIRYYRRIIRINPVADSLRDRVISELRDKYAQDNVKLWGTRRAGEVTRSTVDESELRELISSRYINRRTDSDRIEEKALQILSRRRNIDDTRRLLEQLLEFYETRGNTTEALRVVTRLRRAGHFNDHQAQRARDRIRGN